MFFFDDDEAAPADAIRISNDDYHRLLSDMSRGYVVNQNLTTEVANQSADEKSISSRMLRDSVLNNISWIIERHRDELEAGIATTLSVERYAELQSYRQQLRDWPAQPGWPDIEMPPAPDWLAELKK